MNTRFRPTPTGDLHLGHIWTCLHNWTSAVRGGDEFLLIVDDICYQLQNVWMAKWQPEVWVARYIEDLTWLGIAPTRVHYSSTNAEAHAEAADRLGIRPCGRAAAHSFEGRGIGTPEQHSPPADYYHEWLTLTRVVDDNTWGVQAFTRGADLIGEREFYDHLWRRLYPAGAPPRQSYVPLVRREKAPAKEAKSGGSLGVRALRQLGYTAHEIIDTVKECARVSALQGLADVVIPSGVLSADAHKALRWQGDVLNMDASAEGQAAEPWYSDVRAQCDEQIERSNRAAVA